MYPSERARRNFTVTITVAPAPEEGFSPLTDLTATRDHTFEFPSEGDAEGFVSRLLEAAERLNNAPKALDTRGQDGGGGGVLDGYRSPNPAFLQVEAFTLGGGEWARGDDEEKAHVAMLEVVAAKVAAAMGLRADVDFPGCITVGLGAELTTTFGTANENWGGDLTNGDASEHYDSVELDPAISSDSTDADAIATGIVRALARWRK